jgi:GTP cyclohydrolase II
MRCTAYGRTRMLASDATTPSLTSSVTKSRSTRSHYNRSNLTSSHHKTSGDGAFRLEKVAEAAFPTRWGEFRIYGFAGHHADRVEEAVVLEMGILAGDPAPLVRIHSECLTGDVFHSLRCDCRAQLELALSQIAAEGRGLLIYEHQEGRGIGLLNKLRAYELQDAGADTVEANERLGFESDLRSYELPGAILRYFGLNRVRLLSNNPQKVKAVERAGVNVVERIPCLTNPVASSEAYLRTKKDKMGHLIDGL